MIRSVWERTRDWVVSPVLPLAVIIFAAMLVRPWGDFPINDDWQYTHIAMVLAKTGQFIIDRPIAPALVVQSVLGSIVIKAAGASHVALRATTFGLACVGLLLIDVLLRHALIGRWRRALIVLVVALNPIGFVCSLSFMTEIYGTVPALAAAYVWLRAPDEQAPSLLRALAATGFACLAYLTRQFSGLILPALIGASILGALHRRRWRPLAQFIPHLASLLLFLAVCVTHWLWNKASQNETEQLAGPLSTLLRPKGAALSIMGGLGLLYLTAFLSPLLPALAFPRLRKLLLPLALTVCGIAIFHLGLERFHAVYPQTHLTFTKEMPYLTNVVAPGGIGPFTTIEVYLQKGPKGPQIQPWVWKLIGRALFALMLFWPVIHSSLTALATASWRRQQLALTGLLFAVGSFGVTLQVYGMDLFDRYLWTVFIGLALALGSALPDATRWRPIRAVASLALLGAMGTLTVGGTHDYFHWQKSRAYLYRRLLENNISPLSIDAGYELNGWYAYDGWRKHEQSPSCVSTCRADVASWFVVDSSYRISTIRRPNEIVIDRVQPRAWLAKHPMLLLTRRPDP